MGFLVLGKNSFYLRRKKQHVKFWHIFKENLRITEGYHYYYFTQREATKVSFLTPEQEE